jgi:hypothetical protein
MTEVTPVLDKIGKPGDPLYDIVSRRGALSDQKRLRK